MSLHMFTSPTSQPALIFTVIPLVATGSWFVSDLTPMHMYTRHLANAEVNTEKGKKERRHDKKCVYHTMTTVEFLQHPAVVHSVLIVARALHC